MQFLPTTVLDRGANGNHVTCPGTLSLPVLDNYQLAIAALF